MTVVQWKCLCTQTHRKGQMEGENCTKCWSPGPGNESTAEQGLRAAFGTPRIVWFGDGNAAFGLSLLKGKSILWP